MKFRFNQYQYQSDAANAVCDTFKGQPKCVDRYIRDVGIDMPDAHLDSTHPGPCLFPGSDLDESIGYRNSGLTLSPGQLLSNLQRIQQQHSIPLSNQLSHTLGALELDIEMETGTGKTFVYTKTMFELNRRYGWSKFIIIVPSIAIREGVDKSLDLTANYFYTSGIEGKEGYKKKLCKFVYNSSELNNLDDFAKSPDISVMIINIQAFNASMKEGSHSKDARIIFSERDEFGSRRPIDVIRATHPIIILDEPQKMGGKATQNGIRQFNPLFLLNYSATHKVKHNLVYALDALDAYNQRLVKRIEVKGFELHNMRGIDGYLYLQDIIVSPNHPPHARIEYKKAAAAGNIIIVTGTFSEKDSIYTASGELEAYHDNWCIAPDGIVPDQDNQLGYVRFLNGEILHKGQVLNDGSETDIHRVQIRETILSHLEKEEHLWARGIKCLSLFFIDEVAKYRQYDDNNEPVKGQYAVMFEEEYDRCVRWFLENRLNDGHGYLDYLRKTTASEVHQGYFSIDKHGHAINSIGKGKNKESDDISAYDLILKDKERLLSFEEPTRFIFSHSALREGWDNPNVFQICTLKHSANEISKRQEVGRGLRLCVNKEGIRQDVNVLGESMVQEVNLLTVIASESYEKFAASLQEDMKEDLRDRPSKVDSEFFAKLRIPAEKLGAEHINDDPITFSAEEAEKIPLYLFKADLIDDNGKPTDTYRDEGLKPEVLAGLPEATCAKAPAIEFALNSILQGLSADYLSNGLATKVSNNPLNDNWDKKEFQELWKRINHKYAYTVNFDDKELIDKAIQAIDTRLTVSELSYTVTRGIQRQEASVDQVTSGEHFQEVANGSVTREIATDVAVTVKYDLLGEIAQAAVITRRCAAEILKGIRKSQFNLFHKNPEQFIARVSRLIVEQKATMIVDHISYDRIEGQYDASIFTNISGNVEKRNAYQAEKCIQQWVFPDGKPRESVEWRFAESLDHADEVAVYAKLPRGFQIPTPVGNYAPDWAIAFRGDHGIKHLFFIAETKGSMETLELRGIEEGKIACAKRLFNELNLAEDVHYEQVVTYQDLLEQVKALQ